jgi:hypothetical protein
MQYVQMTKLVNGYQPTRVWVNPSAVIYIEERIERRRQGGDTFIDVPKGARLQFSTSAIDVLEAPDIALAVLSRKRESQVDEEYEAARADLVGPSYEDWEAKRERLADAVYGPRRD